MSEITIPPEVVEAAARALHDASGTADCWDSVWDEMARAACLAMLKAWPMKQYRAWDDVQGVGLFIILPLPHEARDE